MKRLGELSQLVSGQVSGPEGMEIAGAASISRAGPADITFVTSSKYLQQFLVSEAAAAVVHSSVLADQSGIEKPVIAVDDVEVAFEKIAIQFQPPVKRESIGISSQAIVSPSAKIADDVSIYPGAVIMDNVEIGFGSVIYPNVTVMENCVIGANVKIFPNATLYENTVVGDRSIIHAGVVLGAYGFGYKSGAAGHTLSAQLGNVVVESDVEIGANTTIDRGTFDSTVIGAGSKLDNLVMVGHNCVIGENNLFCSQVGIAGSCTTGDFVVMGGQVGLADHLNIASKASIAAKSGLMHDVEAGAKMFGIPARNAREELQIIATRAKLPEIRKTVSKLLQRVEKLETESVDDQDTSDTRAA